MEITYYASNDTMGDTSKDDCNRFRTWAAAQLCAEYPGASIIVTIKQHIGEVEIYLTDDEILNDVYPSERNIEDFCSRLWDRMEW